MRFYTNVQWVPRSGRRTVCSAVGAIRPYLSTPTHWGRAMSELLSSPDIGRPTLRLLKDDDPRTVQRRDLHGDSVPSPFRGGLAGSVLRRIRSHIDAHIGERISL